MGKGRGMSTVLAAGRQQACFVEHHACREHHCSLYCISAASPHRLSMPLHVLVVP